MESAYPRPRAPVTYTKMITPLPRMKILIACTIIFINSFMASVILPFLSFMITDFQVAANIEDTGRYSGYLVSSFMIGQLLLSYFWGLLSDRYGRRPILLFGLLTTSIAFLAFGFSTSYRMALLLHGLTGAFNGIVGVCKTYMSEITDSTNQAKGFSVFGVARGMGMIFGPIVGGFLCMPAKKYPQYFPAGSIFDIYPYALPCVIGSILTLIVFITSSVFLEESNTQISKSDSKLVYEYIMPSRTFAYSQYTELRSDPIRSDDISIVHRSFSKSGHNLMVDFNSNSFIQAHSQNREDFSLSERGSISQLLKTPKVFYSLLFYAIISYVYIQFDEIFAIWSRLPITDGGLIFDTSDQGTAYFIGGFALFLYQFLCFTSVENYFGTLSTFRMGLLLSAPSFIILPLVGDFASMGLPRSLIWLGISTAQILRQVFGFQAFTCIFIMTSNSTHASSRGSINGIAQALGSFGRVLGPIFAGSVFSWSLSINYFPIDFHFIFWICAIILFTLYLASYTLDETINYRIRETTGY